ncbi:MAG: hypothetical protein QM726_04880 [Chitinophagaceae bacterium]
MKTFLLSITLAATVSFSHAQVSEDAPNVFIITLDGFRWQELFNGADPSILSNPAFVKDTSLAQDMFGGNTIEERRKNLLPFFWNTIARNGKLYGNRNYNNKANVKNIYKISYPGYNEIFTGYADPAFILNTPKPNKNLSLPAYLNTLPAYRNSVVAFSSWNIFPYILNEDQYHFSVNSGYENLQPTDSVLATIDQVQDSVQNKTHCRYDQLTFLLAKQYVQQKHPKVVVLGFGETDEYAHNGRYDMYLTRAHDIDAMIAELWYFVQTDPFYKNNTSFVITTDHGRGRKNDSWPGHHLFIKGSGEIWLALLGRGIEKTGEIKTAGQIYQNQIAQTIAGLLGEKFIGSHPTGKPIDLSYYATKAQTQQIGRAISAK